MEQGFRIKDLSGAVFGCSRRTIEQHLRKFHIANNKNQLIIASYHNKGKNICSKKINKNIYDTLTNANLSTAHKAPNCDSQTLEKGGHYSFWPSFYQTTLPVRPSC